MSQGSASYEAALKRVATAQSAWSSMNSRLEETISWLRGTTHPYLFVTMATEDSGPLRYDAWPDAEQMAAVINELAASREAVVKAYQAIPQALRSSVIPPPERTPGG